MIKNFEQLKEMLKAMPVKRKVAVVPAQDEHTLEAISHAYRDGMVEPVLSQRSVRSWLRSAQMQIR